MLFSNIWTNSDNIRQPLTRGQKVQSRREREIWYSFLQFREEKEKPEIPFPSFERRKRNLKKGSPLSRRERERDFLFSSFERRKRIFFKSLQLREEKENLKFFSPVLRREREIWKSVLHFREEKEKWILFSQDSRGEREFLPGFLKSFPFLQSFANHIATAKAVEKVKVYIVRNVILAAMQCINHGWIGKLS